MSCCSSCAQGYGCESEMSFPTLLGGLMGALVAPGSVVRVGFAYNYDSTSAGVEAERQGAGWLQQAIAGQLQAVGVFSSVSVYVQQPQYGNFQDGYITVQLTTREQQSDPEIVGDTVQYAIQAYAPGISIERRDAVVIDSIPASAVGQSGVAQVTQQQQVNSNIGGSSQCNWDTQSIGDYLACQFGISSPVGGIAAGTVAGALGLLLIGGAALILLKRF
jgi:hypothetical protein